MLLNESLKVDVKQDRVVSFSSSLYSCFGSFVCLKIVVQVKRFAEKVERSAHSEPTKSSCFVLTSIPSGSGLAWM